MTNGTRLTTADPARDLAAEAKVLQLQQENDCLREWKDSVSAAIQSFQEFAAGEWAGDKSGWGYHHCVITWAQRELTKLRGVIAQHDLCHDLHGKVGGRGLRPRLRRRAALVVRLRPGRGRGGETQRCPA